MSLCPDSCQDISQEEFEHWKWKRCRKYSFDDHAKFFIPIKEFGIDNLPDSAKCPALVERVKTYAYSTVRILVRYMSPNRPEKFMIGTPGSTSLRYGTGCATAIDLEDIRGHSLVIATAAHVVYDSSEAEHTTVEFFFDDDNDRANIIKAKAGRVLTFETSDDCCQFVCHCEDEREERKIIKKTLGIRWPGVPKHILSNIAICVSHPHGLAKRVSIGQVVKYVEEKEDEGAAGRGLKLLVGKCVCGRGMNEKHVLYWYIKTFNTICMSLRTGNSQQSRILDKVLSYLVHKGMVECPSKREEKIIKLQYNAIMNINSSEAGEIFKKRYGTNNINKSNGESHVKFNKIFSEIEENKLSMQMLPDGFAERCRLLFREKDDKVEELTTGFSHSQGDSGMAKYIHYSVPTCPGTSGARVNAYKLENGVLKHFITPHSKGDKDYNSSGSGVFYIYRPAPMYYFY